MTVVEVDRITDAAERLFAPAQSAFVAVELRRLHGFAADTLHKPGAGLRIKGERCDHHLIDPVQPAVCVDIAAIREVRSRGVRK